MVKKFLNPDLPAVLVRISGIITLLSISVKRLPLDSYRWLPFNPYHLASATTLVTALGLIYLASQLHRKKRSAYISTIIILAFLIVFETTHGRSIEQAMLYGISLGYLFSKRKDYVVKNDAISLGRNFSVAGILLISVIGYTAFTFERIDQIEYGRDLSSTQTLHVTVDAMLGDPLPSYLHPTGHDRNLLFSLQASFVIGFIIIGAGLFYPVRLKRKFSPRARANAQKILEKYSASSEDYLKLWPKDKHYYFYRDSFLAYGHGRGIAMILDGAAGDPADFDNLRSAFLEECRINAWKIAILHADQTERDAWVKLGVKDIYLGSEARVNVATFVEERLRDKHFRYITNKATKDGLEVREIAQPLSTHQAHELRIVSDEWLASGRREYAFMMGYFDRNYLAECRIFAVYKGDEMVAYTNLLPSFDNPDMSIDHMRFKQHVSPATMHFLLMKTIVSLNDSGARTLNLGLSPLSKIDENTDKMTRHVMNTIRRFGGRYYSFAGLEQFKNKFGPDWEPTYLLHSGIKNLASVGAAVNTLTTHREFKIPKIPIAIAVIAGAFYSSFPLAILLNPRYAWHDYVSALGQAGQPYAWLFNDLDVISSVLIVALVLYLIRTYRKPIHLLKVALYLLLASAIGNLIAAMATLPNGVDNPTIHDLDDFSVLLHLLASSVNSVCYFIAVGLWAFHFYRVQKKNSRHILTLIIFLLGTVGLVAGRVFVESGAYIQRAFILCYAIWLVWFVYDYVTTHAPRFKL